MERPVALRRAAQVALSAAALATLLGAAHPAAAQSAVERRVQELERELTALKQIVREQSKTVRETQEMAKKAAPATARSGNSDVELKIYGQVNRAVLFADDGKNSDTLFVDNDMSSSRVGFEGKAKVSSNFSVGAKIEVEIQENPSNSANLTTEDDSGSQGGFAVRKVELALEDKRIGKLVLGQQSQAHDGAAEVDISGTGVFLGSLQDNFGGGIVFVNSTTGTKTGPTIATVFPNFDGSREDSIRYYTPEIAGFVASASAESDDRVGFSLEWAGKFAGIKGEAMLGYERIPDSAGTAVATPSNILVGSASFIHDSGISVTVASGRRELEEQAVSRDDLFYLYGKLGYTFSAFEFGKTSVGFDVYDGSNQAVNNDESRAYGVGLVQKVDKAALELYGGVRLFQYDSPTATFEDVVVGMTGARVKF